MSSNEQLLDLGTPCSYPHCSLLDFLAFKCPHCPGSPAFCAEHFPPNCPLCSVPIAIPPGEDPNVRMERHISRFCEAMNAIGGRQGKSGSKICARGKCGKVLFAPIGCDRCHKEFCPHHRFPQDHSCPSLISHRPNTNSTSKPTSKRTIKPSATPSSFSAISATLPSSRPAPSSKPASAPSSKLSIPISVSVPKLFSKTDRLINRRAKEERSSRRKAMTDRTKRGLLTEAEKLSLAQEEAARAQEGRKRDKRCLVM
ncbi:hypothetical protein DEU56DRAFT_872110 [Suillus clintonianus]|uniref:uncharacterized protein n=1 Tax=Suillus clintonianus TaxID=1904413 RepID=UPI001B85C11E|nr:uncharacterized protein DEU56DRAFT_872110 [Suillus clintonianus]KAG2131775.1 hypothetical protein DEU56DRAFT_872110 [Suillus clintonianus]